MKKILLASVVAIFALSGCLSNQDAKPTAQKVTDEAKKVEDSATKATKKAEDGISKAKDATAKAEAKVKETDVETPPQSSLKDEAIEKAVEVADEHTDGKASQIIESVQ